MMEIGPNLALTVLFLAVLALGGLYAWGFLRIGR